MYIPYIIPATKADSLGSFIIKKLLNITVFFLTKDLKFLMCIHNVRFRLYQYPLRKVKIFQFSAIGLLRGFCVERRR